MQRMASVADLFHFERRWQQGTFTSYIPANSPNLRFERHKHRKTTTYASPYCKLANCTLTLGTDLKTV